MTTVTLETSCITGYVLGQQPAFRPNDVGRQSVEYHYDFRNPDTYPVVLRGRPEHFDTGARRLFTEDLIVEGGRVNSIQALFGARFPGEPCLFLDRVQCRAESPLTVQAFLSDKGTGFVYALADPDEPEKEHCIRLGINPPQYCAPYIKFYVQRRAPAGQQPAVESYSYGWEQPMHGNLPGAHHHIISPQVQLRLTRWNSVQNPEAFRGKVFEYLTMADGCQSHHTDEYEQQADRWTALSGCLNQQQMDTLWRTTARQRETAAKELSDQLIEQGVEVNADRAKAENQRLFNNQMQDFLISMEAVAEQNRWHSKIKVGACIAVVGVVLLFVFKYQAKAAGFK